MCDDKNYKDFKTYRKNILKNKGLSMNNDEMIQARTDYANLINNSKEEKRLFLLTKILEEKKLGVIKTENARYVNEIQIADNVMEYQNVIDERNEIEASNKEAIVVNLNEDYLSFEDNEIKEEPIEKNLEIHN